MEAAPAKPPAEVAAPRPVPVDVPPAPQPSAPKAAADSTHSDDPKVRAARVAAWLKDVKGSAAALKLAGCVVRSPVEFYGAVRIAVSELDAAMRLEGGVPKLDVDRMGQVSLLLGAYLITAAANFGLGVGLGADVAATAS